MRNAKTGYYFALPRLLARMRGASYARTEMNWLEANVVGGAVHGIAYLFAAQIFLRGLTLWQQGLLLFPLAVSVWLAWLLILYLDSLLIGLLRLVGLLRGLPDDRAQSIVIGVMITGFAITLCLARSWLAIVGGIWIAAVAFNLAAAVVLALLSRDGSAVT